MQDLSLQEFADRISEIIPVMMKEFARQQISELYKGKITIPQLFVLDYLSLAQEIMMKDLARHLNVTTAAVTGIVKRLVRDEYCVRVFDPKDRRIIKIKLTNKGTAFLEKINLHRRQMIINIFGEISQADRQEYLRILTRVKEILTKKQKPEKANA